VLWNHEFAGVDKLRCSGLGQAQGMIMGFVLIALAAAKGLSLHKSISFLSKQRDWVL
jgi:hypothetical protein